MPTMLTTLLAASSAAVDHARPLVLGIAPGAAGSLGGTEGPDMTRYLVVCSALLLGLAGLAYGFRRLAGRSLAGRAARRSLQVMDVLPLGGRSRLAVVRCYDRTFLLGMGEREVSLVAELDGVIAPEETPLPDRADREAFARLLSRAPVRAPAAAPAPATVPAAARSGGAAPEEAALTPRRAVAPRRREDGATGSGSPAGPAPGSGREGVHEGVQWLG